MLRRSAFASSSGSGTDARGQTTPPLHLEMADWLGRRWREGDRRLVLLVFRSAGKSTLVGIFCAWLLLNDPDLRILVLAAEHDLARKMVRNVKRIIERHPLTRRSGADRGPISGRRISSPCAGL